MMTSQPVREWKEGVVLFDLGPPRKLTPEEKRLMRERAIRAIRHCIASRARATARRSKHVGLFLSAVRTRA